MPMEYRIDPEQRVVFMRGWGRVTFADALAHQQALRADPEFRGDLRELIDFSEVTELVVSYTELSTLAQGTPFGTGAFRAVVLSSDLVFGIARMYQALGDRIPEHGRLFRDAAQARRWLGLRDED